METGEDRRCKLKTAGMKGELKKKQNKKNKDAYGNKGPDFSVKPGIK